MVAFLLFTNSFQNQTHLGGNVVDEMKHPKSSCKEISNSCGWVGGEGKLHAHGG